ncbi:transposable element Tcb2 transposase [Trichonephila clavipes]|nr:transposable element Tcb2 transposase [Trichonephila clavipes]
MNVRYMSKDKFASCEKVTAEVMKSYAQEEMVKAILDEKQLAESRGDIDSDGYYCITLIVDGGWCKRSYGHGYNASSGVSVLIGWKRKIICAGKTGKDHQQQWKVIVLWKVYCTYRTVHHIRCTRLVGDGDSNTIAKCRERISYGGRILKVECANHAVRRYGRAIHKLQGNTTRFSGPAGIKGRQLLKQKIMKLIKGVRNAIKSNAINNHNQPQKETVSNLISDLRNVPNHVFGSPVVCVPLTRQHRSARLQWCREHHNWTEQDWAHVLFSDESRFSLSSDCRRQLIWRESGTAYRPENIQEKDRYPTCSIMVWAGIMINGRTRLHVVANGTMTGQRYIDEVLLPHVRLFRGAVGDKFVFMDDNETCHRTLAVQDCLDSEGIQRLVWQARSPDLNPIENVWEALGRQVAGRNYPPTNKNTLIRALTEEWDKLPQQLLDNVVQSMVRRVECCITLHGGHIPY